MPAAVTDTNGLKLYEATAERLQRLIDEGTFRVGDRLPSVRRLSREWDVSITTVLEAYRLLENRGAIAARPQSGHYVQARWPAAPTEPSGFARIGTPKEASTSALALEVLRGTHDTSLLQLGTAVPNPDLLPVERLNRTLGTVTRRMKARGLSYEIPAGNRTLRGELARRCVVAGCALSPDDIVVTTGATEAVNLSLRAVCKHGDVVAVESPFYFGFIQALEGLGLRALEIPMHPREGMSIEALRLAMTEHGIRAVLACPNFSNPLGTVMPDARKEELVALCAERNVPLIEDDIYGDLAYDGTRPRAAKAFDRTGIVLYCTSISKTLAPGWRIGWAAPGRFRDEFEQLKALGSLATATPMQLAVAEFLATGGYEHHLRSLRRGLQRRAEWLGAAIARHFPAGTRVTRPSGGLVLWVELPEGGDGVALHQEAKRIGVLIAPGLIFSTMGRYRNCLRLNVAFAGEDAEGKLALLGDLAKRMCG